MVAKSVFCCWSVLSTRIGPALVFNTTTPVSNSPSLAMYRRKIFQSIPWKPCPIPAKLLPTADLVEEEHTPHYKPQHFYPVRLYQILNKRYQIAAKIGYGTSSTVWLARDLHQYVISQ